MATVTKRGNTFCVRVPYNTNNNEYKTHWETYRTEIEAMQRKALYDCLQKVRDNKGILKAIAEYTEQRNAEKIENGQKTNDKSQGNGGSNFDKTLGEFYDRWLPKHARRKRFSPNSYDNYRGIIECHVLPYFGDRIMSSITVEEWDDFFDHLTLKPCGGSKAYNKEADEIPTLSAGTILKIYNIVKSGFNSAKTWNYIKEIPTLTPPKDRTFKKRGFWYSEMLHNALLKMPNVLYENSHLMHLSVHLAFIGSLRAGEVAGIKIDDLQLESSMYEVKQEVQRVSDDALKSLPPNEIYLVFPKQKAESTTSMILKNLKTEKSERIQYLTLPLRKEISRRLRQIEANKAFYGGNYNDYGLLLCHPNGNPIEPRILDRWFKKWQRSEGIDPLIDFQGIRKSGQMHKKRLEPEPDRSVAATAGHTTAVMEKHYDEKLESDKRRLIQSVEKDFYTREDYSEDEWRKRQSTEIESISKKFSNDPNMLEQLLLNNPKALQDVVRQNPEIFAKYFKL